MSQFEKHPLPWRIERSILDGPEYVWIFDSKNVRIGRFERDTAEFIIERVNRVDPLDGK